MTKMLKAEQALGAPVRASKSRGKTKKVTARTAKATSRKTDKQAAKKNEEKLPPEVRIAAQLTETRLDEVVVTHMGKLASTAIADKQSLRIKETAVYDPAFRAGLCSCSTDSVFGYGALGGGQKVGVAQALAGDLGGERPGSLLSFLDQRANQAPAGALVDEATWARFLEEMPTLEDKAPERIQSEERLVFFESTDDELLVTPVGSVKLVHELNYRFRARDEAFWAAWRVAKNGAEKSGVKLDYAALPPRAPANTLMSHGGAQPQNVGYIVNKTKHDDGTLVRNTRRGGLPVFMIEGINRRLDAPRQLLARLGASKSYAAIARVDYEACLAYAKRSRIDIDLASHREAELVQAVSLASQFCEACEALRGLISGMPKLKKVAPWKDIESNLLTWLDPRLGEFDREALARDFGRRLAWRIQGYYRRDLKQRASSEAGEGQGGGSARLSPRSQEALIEAFRRVL